MAAQAIGALFVQLGLDSAQFVQGLKQSQSNLAKFGRNMAAVGAGIAAAGATAFAAFNNSSNRLSDLKMQADIAGLSAQEFKVAALAVDQYGISQEKLSDILKDVNDKFGDFAATGGGELKDFFENIGPKVGVTIENFKNLSSSDALALYVSSLEKANVSQQEMTFYMEALANDATALVPAFRNGGLAIEDMRKKADELGLALDEGLIKTARQAQGEMRLVSDVLRTQFDQAVLKLGPSLSKLAQALMPVVEGMGKLINVVLLWTDIAGKGARRFTDAFIQGIAALPGIVSDAFGAAIEATGSALEAAGTVALDAVINLIDRAFSSLFEVAGDISKFTDIAGDGARNGLISLGAAIGQGLANIAVDAGRWTLGIVRAIIEGLKGLYEAGAQAVRDLAAGMAAEFVALKDRALGWGRDIADGLKQGLDAAKDRVRGAVSSVADTVKGVFTDEMEIQSPSRVFMRFGGFITEGLQKGIEAGGSGVQGAMQDMAAGVSDVFKAVLFEGASFKDSMKSMLGSLFSGWGSNFFQQGISGLGKAIGLPFFARGGFHSGGLRIVGENGPELEATGPARYFSASQTRRMMGEGLGNQDVNVTVSVDQNGNLQAFVDRRVERGGQRVLATAKAAAPGWMDDHQTRRR